MTAKYGINVSITVEGVNQADCDQLAFYFKEVIRVKLFNTLNKNKKQVYKELISYEVELPNLQSEPL